MLTSCTDDDVVVVNPDQPVVLNCMKPDYLKSGESWKRQFRLQNNLFCCCKDYLLQLKELSERR